MMAIDSPAGREKLHPVEHPRVVFREGFIKGFDLDHGVMDRVLPGYERIIGYRFCDEPVAGEPPLDPPDILLGRRLGSGKPGNLIGSP